MTCNRCEDVHKAQKEGKTQNACKCSCHDNWTTTGGTDTWTYTDLGTTITSTGTASTTTLGTDSNYIDFTTSINIDEANSYKQQKE